MAYSNEFNKEIVKHLLALDAFTYSALPTVVAFLLADGLSPSEQGLLAAFISDIGNELAGIALYINAKTKERNAAAEVNVRSKESEEIWLIIESLLRENQSMQSRIEYLESKIREL